MSECLMPNCRKYAPADEAMCAEHRDGGPLDYSALTLRLKTYHDDNSRLTAEIEQLQSRAASVCVTADVQGMGDALRYELSKLRELLPVRSFRETLS